MPRQQKKSHQRPRSTALEVAPKGAPATTTHFGFEQVAVEEKQQKVGRVFSEVASKYDVMNDLMSAGLHRIWKEQMVGTLKLHDQINVLDVAGGTADIATRIAKRMQQRQLTGSIIVSDINAEMLAEGKRRLMDRGIFSSHPDIQFDFQQANAEALPYKDTSFDFYTIAFGIRNVTHIQKALDEAYRVLKPGGQFLCLEFCPKPVQPLQKLYDFYSFQIIPRIGEMVAKDRAAYQYLAESIRMFPDPKTFERMIQQAGFSRPRHRRLSGGIVAIHEGWKL